MLRSCVFALVVVIGSAALPGCGGGPQMSEVEGTVKMKGGKPLEKIHVEFWPEGNGPKSFGLTDAEGRFTLTTDDGKQKGAWVGKHRIVLQDVSVFSNKYRGRAADGVDITEGKKPRIGKQYSDPQKTPLHREVTAGKCAIELDVTP